VQERNALPERFNSTTDEHGWGERNKTFSAASVGLPFDEVL
jgi:hypothetical protein